MDITPSNAEVLSDTIEIMSNNRGNADIKDNSFVSSIYDAIRIEYEHSVHRSDKLDNKVYILVTVCAFLFVLMASIIDRISCFKFPETRLQLTLIIVFSVFLFLGVLVFIVLLILLMRLLKGVQLKRYRTGELLENDIASYDPLTAATFIGARLEKCTTENYEIVEKRFKVFNLCTHLIVFVIIDLVFLSILCQFIDVV